MLKIATMFRGFSLLLIAALFASGCTEEDNPITGGGTAPTNVKVTSISATSIGVAWTRNASDVGVDSVVATPTSGVLAGVSASVPSPGTQAILQGLANGQEYSITVWGGGKASASVKWAPATRAGTFRLFETADNRVGNFSGLILDPANVRTVSVGASSADRALADLVFASDLSVPNTFTSLVSPSISSLSGITGGKSTVFSDSVFVVAGGLNSQYFTSGLGTFISGSVNAADIAGALAANVAGGGNAVLFVKTASNNYARVEIVRQPSGLLYGNDKDGQQDRFFIDVNVSLQPTPNLPYAGRPQRRGVEEAKHPVQHIITLD